MIITVPFFDMVPLQNIGELAHFSMQLLVSESHFVPGFAFPDQGRFIPCRPGQMPVETVLRNIQFAADEPLRERLFPFENRLPLFLPDQKLRGLLRPEFLRVFYRFAI